MKSLETRFRALRSKVAGTHEINEIDGFVHDLGPTRAERADVVPANPWHQRILAELDFCLQMKAHAGTDVTKEVDAALAILEKAQEVEGAWPDSVCAQAEECLLPLAKEAHTYTLLLVGHAHLDMNWMWGWDETVATVVATFRTMLRLMDEYPEFHFSQSQASTYKIIEDYAPEMMPEIQKRIQEGRWEVTASAWVEPDKNMPCNESLMNHIVYTKKYLKEHWGIDPESLDLDFVPDTFGHSAFLPELDSLGGIKYYYHCRGVADTSKVLYRWKAPSGKELLMYREPYWYNSSIRPICAIGIPRVASLCGGLRTAMQVYGVGDHGGGPTRRDINNALEMQKWPVFPRIQFGRMRDYFKAAETVREKLPVLEGEHNAIFTGCYTTQSRVKKGNHRAEKALLNAEQLSALTVRELGGTYDERAFEKGWQNTLFTHFHDILTGSCVQDSREHAMGLYQEAISIANCRSVNALEKLTAEIDTSTLGKEEDITRSFAEGAGVGFGVTSGNIPTQENAVGMTRIFHIINTTGVERHENATLTVWDWPGNVNLLQVTDVDGNPLAIQQTSEWKHYWKHHYFNVMVTVTVPAYGYTTVVLGEKEPIEVTDSWMGNIMKDLFHPAFEDTVLENKYIRASFDCRSGELYSLIDKETGKECLREGETGGLRYIRAQKHSMSSWVIDRYLEVKKVTELVKFDTTKGPLYSGIVTEHKVENSRVTTTVSLGSEDKFLKVGLLVDWKEESKSKEEQPVLSYCLPISETTGRMFCDVPGGALWRQGKEQDTPCQRYAAAEMSDGRVLALASDCKYGFRLSRGDLMVTLINTADNPDPYPERGIQEIDLFIMPAVADAAILAKETDICMNPLQYVTNTSHAGTLPLTASLLQTEGDSVVFTGVAQRDGCLAVRMYEAAGKESPVTVTVRGLVAHAELTDLFGNKVDVPITVEKQKVCFKLAPYVQAELRIRNK